MDRSALRADSPSRLEGVAHATLGVAIDVPDPLPPALPPQTPLSAAIGLYEAGEPPPSTNPVLGEMYRRVCADRDRTRARQSAYDSGDEIARRQDCYCADTMPCSVNRDCTDLIACHPQIALCDVDTQSSSD